MGRSLIHASIVKRALDSYYISININELTQERSLTHARTVKSPSAD